MSRIRHWPWDEERDRPSASRENEARWEAFSAVLRAWRDLDPAAFREHLSDEGFQYGSYWVRDPMVGKESYLDYITKKFETIRSKGGAPTASVVIVREAITPQTYCYAILFRQGQDRARELGLYMQKYCGCVFSEEERYIKPKKLIP